MRRALAAGVDWIEADIWLHYGRLVARHDPTLWRLPITYSRGSLSLVLAPAMVLDTLVRATAQTATRVLIDLKGENVDLPARLVDALRTRGALHRAALCGQKWEPLDVARALEPELAVVFSLGRPEHLDAYLVRRRDDTAPPVASCYHGLLTPATVASLKEAGTTIIAWTVDSQARAQQLLLWGVDGITSNRYTMLN
ncbi:MAG: glycerophosphodiester phosphodiesterase, partial [Dehalococcoidia bacterium]